VFGIVFRNNAENRRRELYTRTHIVDDSIGGAKTKTKTKTKKQRTMPTTTTTQALETQVRLVLANILETSLQISETTELMDVTGFDIRSELRGSGPWTLRRLEDLSRMNAEFVALVTRLQSLTSRAAQLEVQLAEAKARLAACNVQTQLATIDHLNLALCELESERLWYEQNATTDLTALSEIDEEIQDVKELLQSTRYRVRTHN